MIGDDWLISLSTFSCFAFRQKHLHQSLQTHHQQTLRQFHHVLNRFDLLQILTQYLISQVSSLLVLFHAVAMHFVCRTINVTTNRSKVKMTLSTSRRDFSFVSPFSSTQMRVILGELIVASTSIVILLFQKHIEQLTFTHQNELRCRTAEHQQQLETLERTHQDQIKEFQLKSQSIEVKRIVASGLRGKNEFSPFGFRMKNAFWNLVAKLFKRKSIVFSKKWRTATRPMFYSAMSNV